MEKPKVKIEPEQVKQLVADKTKQVKDKQIVNK